MIKKMHIDYEIEDKIKYLLDIVLKEAKKEDRLTKQLFITMFSAYSNNPINLLINAPSGVRKNYVRSKLVKIFPEDHILPLAGMNDKALFQRSRTFDIAVLKLARQFIDCKIDKKLSIQRKLISKVSLG
jgi:hypothetical protein